MTKLEKECSEVRRMIIETAFKSGRGHLSSALSSVEILVALYLGGCIDCSRIKEMSSERERVVLSKGHAGLALYCTLIQAGIIKKDMLKGFATKEGVLSTHPVSAAIPGIEMSAGSLGQGMGFACGTSLAAKLTGERYHTYVIVGDGELQEGSNWEAMLAISQFELDNLTLIIDRNYLQISGAVEDIISLEPLQEKLKSFGFYTIEVDGHDSLKLLEAYQRESNGKPKAIIANTVKGKGVSFIENALGWHGRTISADEYRRAMEENQND